MATAIKFGIGVADHSLQREGCRRGNRRITEETGRALQILGHAIEYLTDEYVHETANLSASDPQIQAICLLMNLNREVYYECPVIPTFGERLASFLRGNRA